MRNRSIILAVCLAALLFRLIVVAQTPTLAPEAYSTVRQVEHIRETGLPLFTDTLAGHPLRPLPVFPYLLAFTTVIFPTGFVYAIIPNIIAVLLQAAIFLLVLELTNNRGLATTAAIASIFIPSYLSATLFTLSPLCLAIPLLFFFITLFVKLRKSKEHRYILLGLLILLLGTSPIAILLIPFLILALMLATVRRATNLGIQYEFAIFSVFLITWFMLIYYRDAVLKYGFDAIHANIPSQIYAIRYAPPSLLTLSLAVGLVPFGLALYAAYKEGVARHPGIQATISLAIVAAVAILFQLIPSAEGATIIACACCALGAVGLQHLRVYGRTFKDWWIPRAWFVLLFVGFLLTSVFPSTVAAVTEADHTVSPGIVDAAKWLQENSLPKSVVAVQPDYGSLVLLDAQRKVLLDDAYLQESNVQSRSDALSALLNGTNITRVVRENGIDYIIAPDLIQSDCLNTIYRKEYAVMKVLCR